MRLARKAIDEPRPSGSGDKNRFLTVAALPRRRAFTLIEMLVVITIILMLAGMMVMVTPGVSTRQQAARGATQLQTALFYARNRAKMNMLSTGILLSQSNNVWSVQYIQSASDFTQGTATVQPGGTSVTINGASTSLIGVVNQGILPDYFEVAGSGLPHQIGGAGANALSLASPVPSALTQPVTFPTYRIMRSPRLLFGEQPVELPQDVGCLWSSSGNGNNQPGAAFIGTTMLPSFPPYVLFAPSGALTGMSPLPDVVCFYVCDVTSTPTPSNPAPGFPTIIAIYGKSGFITAHPVNTNQSLYVGQPQNYPFYFAMNARSSGM